MARGGLRLAPTTTKKAGFSPKDDHTPAELGLHSYQPGRRGTCVLVQNQLKRCKQPRLKVVVVYDNVGHCSYLGRLSDRHGLVGQET